MSARPLWLWALRNKTAKEIRFWRKKRDFATNDTDRRFWQFNAKVARDSYLLGFPIK